MRAILALFAVIVLWTVGSVAATEPRTALVIGNNDYRYLKPLETAIADARAFRQELEARSFQVIYRENTSRRDMNDAIDEFLSKLSSDSIGVIYYSGHGVQIDNSNYLVPTDLEVRSDAAGINDVINDSIDLERLLERTSSKRAKFVLAIIDACRDNPFASNGRSIGAARGLAPSVSNAQGLMIVYAAGCEPESIGSIG